MTPAYFTVVWDPTTETATVNTVYETFTDDETVTALDQFVACRNRCAEINNLTGVDVRQPSTDNPGRMRAQVVVNQTGPFEDDEPAE